MDTINSYGMFESKFIVNGQTVDEKNISFKKDKKKMDININDNGKQKTLHLDNNDLMSLIKMPNIGGPLEKRLENELLMNGTKSNRRHSRKNNRNTISKRKRISRKNSNSKSSRRSSYKK